MTKLTSVEKTLLCRISHDLQPLTDYGGHLGRHLENNLFPIVGFSGIFSMLFLTPKTTENRWKTFCCNLLGVRPFFTVDWLAYKLFMTSYKTSSHMSPFKNVSSWSLNIILPYALPKNRLISAYHVNNGYFQIAIIVGYPRMIITAYFFENFRLELLNIIGFSSSVILFLF